MTPQNISRCTLGTLVLVVIMFYACTFSKCKATNVESEDREEKSSMGQDEDYLSDSLNLNEGSLTHSDGISVKASNYKKKPYSKPTFTDADKNKTIEQTLHLLEEGNSHIQLLSHADVVLVVGNTGAGKTTVTHFIAGDDSKLIAYEADAVTILIKDINNKISTSTIVSKTIFPQLFIDNATSTAFYDCPGFSDTRNTTIEISNSFFLKKVADSAHRVKILLVINHGSLKPGGDRKDFMLLLKHATDFLQNTEKFQNSIALVATKVDSTQSEHRIISGMATFLNSAKQDLETILSEDDLLKAGQIIDALLTKDEEGTYTKLTFFRQPNETGALKNIHIVQQRKGHIRNVIWNNIDFVPTFSDDFGYTLSYKAQSDIKRLTDAVSDQIQNYFQKMSQQLNDYFIQNLKHPHPSKLLPLQQEVHLLQTISTFLENIRNQTATDITVNSTFTKFLSTTLNQFKSLNSTYPAVSKAILQNGEYLDFLQGVTSGSNFIRIENPQKWFEPLRNALALIDVQLQTLCHRLNSKVDDLIQKASVAIVLFYTQQFQHLRNESESNGNLTQIIQHLLTTLSEMEALKARSKPSEMISQILLTTNQLNPNILKKSGQKSFIQIARFLDNCFDDRNSTLVANTSRWLVRFSSFSSPVKSKLGFVEDAIQLEIRDICTNLTKACETHYESNFQEYKTVSNLRVALENDLYGFLEIFDEIRNLSSPHIKNLRDKDTDFLARVSAKIVNLTATDSTENMAHKINEQINNLKFVRNFTQWDSTENQKLQNMKDNQPIWSPLFTQLATSVHTKFILFFHQLDAKMYDLLNTTSSQLEEYFVSHFNQLTSPSVSPDKFKQEVISLLTRLKDIDDLNKTTLSQLAPSHFWSKLQNYSSSENRFNSELNETSHCLDLVEIFNVNTKINTTRNLPSVTIKQANWVTAFKMFVSVSKSNFKLISDDLGLRIGSVMKNLTVVMESIYASKFSQFQEDEIISFKESLQEDLNTYMDTLGKLNYSLATTKASRFLYSTAQEFSKLQREDPQYNEIRLILEKLRTLGECFDFSYRYIRSQTNPSAWIKPLQIFVSTFNSTLNEPLSHIRNPNDKNTVTFKGTFVRLSEVLNSTCSNPDSKCISKDTENLIILSLHTVYIDADIIRINTSPEEENKQLNVAIISPHWIVQNNRTVNLNGAAGKKHTLPKAGINNHGDGQPGRSGHPGGNAGNFFATGLTVIYTGNEGQEDASLQILAAGGNGGRGQDGGDGSNGMDGENVTLDRVDFSVTADGPYSNQIRLTKHEPLKLQKGGRKCWLVFDFYRCTEYWFNGTLGEKGKDGGSGGAGGFGGKSGLITFVGPPHFKQAFNATLSIDGNIGPGGNGGNGGRGGINGYNGTVQIYPGKYDDGYTHGKKLIRSFPQGAAPNGKPGRNSSNATGRKRNSQTTNTINSQSSDINIFRNFARQSLRNPFTRASTLNFLNQLDDIQIHSFETPTLIITTTMNLMNEFLDLESQIMELKKKNINYIQLYHQFSWKISHLLKSNNKEIQATETKQILTYLYTASLSRINLFETNNDKELNLITDMTKYLNIVQGNLDSFKRQSYSFNVLTIIRNTTRDHTELIKNEISTLQDFTANEILPEIHRLQDELEESVYKLLDEILQLKLKVADYKTNLSSALDLTQEAITDKAKSIAVEEYLKDEVLKQNRALLSKKLSHLKTKVTISNVLQVLSVGSSIIKLFGPKGFVIGMTVSRGIFLAESLLGDVNNEEARTTEIYKKSSQEIIRQNREKFSAFKILLTDIKNKLMRDSKTFEDLIMQIIRIINEIGIEDTKLELQGQADDRNINMMIGTGKPKSVVPMIYQAQEYIRFKKAQIRTELNFTESLVRNSKNKSLTNYEANINLINTIYDDLRLDTEFYIKIRNDQAKLTEIGAALKNTEDKLDELDGFIVKVENEMKSILEKFRSETETETEIQNESFSFESPAHSSIAQWHLSRKIRDIRTLIKNEFTKNYKVDDEVNLTFQKLDEGFAMLIQVYDRIANYQKESRLANCISKINSAAVESGPLQVQDAVLREKVLRVELAIVSNVIVSQYHMIINSLKMSSFPFAAHYLKNIHVPEELIQVQNNHHHSNNSKNVILVHELAEEASRVLKTIATQVDLSKSTHKDVDTYLHNTLFYKSPSTVPFYVWEHHRFQMAIRKLLLGQVVVLKADILKSPQNYDAVKFFRVDLNFRAVPSKDRGRNLQEIQNVLKSELEHYEIKMTHLGNSAYRYDDKYYTIHSEHVSFTFSFQKDRFGDPVNRNRVYNKIAFGDILLSPYTMWQIQLTPFDLSRNSSTLETLANSDDFKFDLELIGNGSYVDKGLSDRLNLDYYYQVDQSISVSKVQNVYA